jgi:hypothetical protein
MTTAVGSSAPAGPVDLPARRTLLGTGWAPAGAPMDDQSARHTGPPPDPAAFVALASRPISVGGHEQLLGDAFGDLEELLTHPDLASVRARVDQVLKGPAKVALCGDYSAGKSSLRAVLTRSTRASRRRVRRRADPTTTTTETARFDNLKLLDTPGLGSSRPDDVAEARRAIEDATLTLYLVTPRLIADLPSPLIDELSRAGLPGSIARLRTRFLLTRIDELGGSPDEAPGEFVTAIQNKRQELARVLTARGIETDADLVIAVAPDPYGSDFDDETLRQTAAWNGLGQISADLREFARTADRRIPALMAGISDLETIRGVKATEVDGLRAVTAERNGMLGSVKRAAADTRTLVDELRTSLEQEVVPVVTEMVDFALRARGKEREAAIAKAQRWHEDPRVAEAIDRWQRLAAEAVKRHVEAVNSELNRQFDGIVNQTETGSGPAFVTAASSSDAADALKRGLGATKGLTQMDAAKVLALRDSLAKLPIPKDALKFKPWGATKLAEKLRYAGKVAAVAGVVIEVASIVHDEFTKKKHEALRRDTRDEVNEKLHAFFNELVDGTEDNPGVARLIGHLDHELTTMEHTLEDAIVEDELHVAAAQATIDLVNGFIPEAR